MDNEVTTVPKDMNFYPIIIPHCCVGKIQTFDVSINHIFKLYIGRGRINPNTPSLPRET